MEKKIDLFENRNARVTAAKLRLGDEAKEKSLSEQVSLGALDATIPVEDWKKGKNIRMKARPTEIKYQRGETLELKETA